VEWDPVQTKVHLGAIASAREGYNEAKVALGAHGA